MTRYLLYFLTGFAHAVVILFYRGYLGAEPTTYAIAALVGAMVLFGLVSWLKLFLEKIGAVMAVLCLLALLPWTVEAGKQALEQDAFLSGALLITHAVLLSFILASFITSLRYIFSRRSWLTGTSRPTLAGKIIVALIPIAILVAWLLVMNKV
ncbi:hypothetical protein ACFSRY_08865 [Pontibacter locisalis]|uniref:Uncharacterized protein n=1 Tax=Pontibacter locisalis TaxID=1719035 RepID=A0ABW5IK10_9BACT